jgi:hypothetical protein
MVGIKSYGAYIPFYRLSRDEIAREPLAGLIIISGQSFFIEYSRRCLDGAEEECGNSWRGGE